MVKGLSEFEKKYNLDVKVDLDALEKSSKSIGNELAKCINKQDPTSKIVPIPMKEALSLIQAGDLDNRIQKLGCGTGCGTFLDILISRII